MHLLLSLSLLVYVDEVGGHVAAHGAPVALVGVCVHVLYYLSAVLAYAQMAAGQADCVSLLLVADHACRLFSILALIAL